MEKPRGGAGEWLPPFSELPFGGGRNCCSCRAAKAVDMAGAIVLMRDIDTFRDAVRQFNSDKADAEFAALHELASGVSVERHGEQPLALVAHLFGRLRNHMRLA